MGEKKEANGEKKVEENIQKNEDITHKEGGEEHEQADQSEVEDKTNSNISSAVSEEKTKVEESIVVNKAGTESNLKGYGYFSEINSGQELFYIINENDKTLLGYTREKIEFIHKLESGKALSEEERTPNTMYKLSGEESEVSRVSQSSLHSDTGIKVSFKTKEVILILCSSGLVYSGKYRNTCATFQWLLHHCINCHTFQRRSKLIETILIYIYTI